MKSSKRKFATIPLMAGLIISSQGTATVQAEQPIGKWNVGARLSTMGIQGEVGYLFNKTFGVRLQSGGYSHYKEVLEFEKEKYHHVRFRPIFTTLYGDWYFLTDWWRLSAGISYNHTKVHIRQKIYDSRFTPPLYAGIAALTFRYKNKITPYLGTGIDYRIPCGSKFIISVDAGINFMGKVKNNVSISGLASQDPSAVPIAKARGKKLLNDRWWVKYYPALSVGVKYEL